MLKIVQYPHPSLRYKARPVVTIDQDLRRIVGEMLELMYAHKGIGLAAPQVAIPWQLFVMNVKGDPAEKEYERVYINPVILEKSGGMVEAEEGCLSFPDLFQNVRRSKQIRVQAYDQNGAAVDRTLVDLESRAVQHETDHLHGVLYIDKFGPIARLASRSALARFEHDYKKAQKKGEISADQDILRSLEKYGIGEL